MAKDWTKTKAYRELKAGLADNLAARELVEPVYQDMLNLYMELWCEFQQLGEDIRERGVVVMDEKRGMLVENRSCTIRHQTSQKMLDIYNALGFRELSTRAPAPETDDDEL
ncbi:MAG: P27 family phage terminase small subunit [Oscillospiraceae bacterium]|nr:P27 family phage terminase small subunit [Oscillospiraceae bacterium]